MRFRRLALVAAVALLTAAGGFLGWSQAASTGGAAAPAGRAKFDAGALSVKRGEQVYGQYCAHCHGAEGKGDGLSGQALPVKPQNLTEGRVLNPLPDHFLYRLIAESGAAVGLSPLMPAFKPQLSDTQIRDVIAYIRTLAQPPFDPKEVLPVPEKRTGPVQPILFSHVIHAGSYRIDCQYCHAGARRSGPAGVPSVERCMGCHKIIGIQGNPEIAKLLGYWERQEPIPWVRVFKVPEHARFPHKNHVQAGLPCQSCHGRIEALEQVYAVTGQNIVNDVKNLLGVPDHPPALTMGWCVECHRAANSKNLAMLAWLGTPAPVLKKKEINAPLDCVACHH